jgi:hypothetical protein
MIASKVAEIPPRYFRWTDLAEKGVTQIRAIRARKLAPKRAANIHWAEQKKRKTRRQPREASLEH